MLGSFSASRYQLLGEDKDANRLHSLHEDVGFKKGRSLSQGSFNGRGVFNRNVLSLDMVGFHPTWSNSTHVPSFWTPRKL